MVLASEIMTTPALTLPYSATLEQLACLMYEANIGIVPIVADAITPSTDHSCRLLGVITDRDIVIRSVAQRRTEVTAGAIMTVPAISAHPSSTCQQLLYLMRSRSIRRLPVTDGDCVVGIVSITDLDIHLPAFELWKTIRSLAVSAVDMA